MLYDQFNRPIVRPESKPDRRPLAAAPLSNAYREYVANGLTPERLAALLRDADNGDMLRQAELFDEIEERDGHIIGEISKRKNVILDAEFKVSPASEDRRDIDIAESVEKMIAGIMDWPDIMVSCQDAVGKGYASFELFWDVSSGQANIEKMVFIEQNRFIFTDPYGNLTRIPRLLTEANTMGEEIPAFKTLFHGYGGMSGHPVRNAIHRICAWWYLFKNYAVKDWLIFLEVYGMPLRLGKYDSGSSQADKDALEIAVRTLGSDAAGIISKSTEIEFVESAKGTANADLYEKLAAFGNKEISKAILGATLTADVGDVGSYAAANTHNEVRLDLMRADARALAATLRNQIIRPWVGFNYGWDAAIPKYEGMFNEAADMKLMSEIFDKMADRMDIPVSHVRRVFDIPEREKDEDVLKPKTAGTYGNAPDGNTHVAKITMPPDDEPDAVDLMADRLSRESDNHIQAMLKPVRVLLAKAESMEDFRDALIDAYPAMDAGDLGNLIARAMTAAELMGMYEVGRDSNPDTIAG